MAFAAPDPQTTTADELPGKSGRGVERPALFLTLESERPLEPPERHSLHEVDSVDIGRTREQRRALRTAGAERLLSLAVPDRFLSSSHARLRRVLGRWMVEDSGSKNGTFVNGKQVLRAELTDGDVLEVGHTFFLFREESAAATQLPAATPSAHPGLTTLQSALAAQLRALEKVAPTNVSVVLRGETGTGKEVLARAVHALSGRSGAFVAINCGALPGALVESELFGYRKGAFSGAFEDRLGLLRTADQGTLFLDELGDLPLPLQTSLLRVLQEREVTPIGGTRPVAVDLRVIVATHRDLEGMSARGEFREDLLSRVSGFSITLPPLRQRREDIGLITSALLRRLLGDGASRIRFTVPAARALLLHHWPLNVRELEKALGVAVALAEDGHIELAHLPPALQAPPPPLPTPAAPATTPPARQLTASEALLCSELEKHLREQRGNITAVARSMGKARVQVQRWLRRFGLDAASYRG